MVTVLGRLMRFEIQREKTLAGGVLFEGLQNAQLYGEIQPTGSAKFSLFGQFGETVDFANAANIGTTLAGS